MIGKRPSKKINPQIVVAVIGLVGVVIGGLITITPNFFKKNGSEFVVVKSPSRTCQYTAGPKKGTTQYFDPVNFPIISPANVGQPCTDGIGSHGIAIKDK